jgi:hypothetical protein
VAEIETGRCGVMKIVPAIAMVEAGKRGRKGEDSDDSGGHAVEFMTKCYMGPFHYFQQSRTVELLGKHISVLTSQTGGGVT